MKTKILLIALTSLSLSAPAQSKKYQPTAADWQKQLSFTVNVTASQFANYGVVLQNGGPQGIANSDKLMGNQITAYTKDYFTVIDSLNSAGSRSATSWYKANEAKWAADTLRLFDERLKGKRP